MITFGALSAVFFALWCLGWVWLFIQLIYTWIFNLIFYEFLPWVFDSLHQLLQPEARALPAREFLRP